MKSTQRFSDRVENYVKYRPSYPKEAIDFLYSDSIGFKAESRIADIGSGTGILTRLLLERGSEIYAVEPNAEMRKAAVNVLGTNPALHSIDGTAEQTGIEEKIDFIICAQSFHWFERAATKTEFRRLLRPGGKAVLMWNERTKDSLFDQRYEELLAQYGTDYNEIKHTNIPEDDIEAFFRAEGYGVKIFSNRQVLDREGFLGRVFSSSYTPLPGSPNYEVFVEELNRLFEACAEDGMIELKYRTEIYFGEV